MIFRIRGTGTDIISCARRKWTRAGLLLAAAGALLIVTDITPSRAQETTATAPAKAESGVSEKGLQAANAYAESRKGISLLVMEKGEIVFEQYHNKNKPEERHKIYSGTKSMWGVAAMVAVDEGIIKLDEKVSDTITEWQNNGDPNMERITIRELLNSTDGLPATFSLHRDEAKDRTAEALRVKSVAAPGRAFIYGPIHLQVFHELLRRKLRSRFTSPLSFLKKKVLKPLGLDVYRVRTDAKGVPLMASGFAYTAREWIKFGQMVLQQGKYNGKQIVSPGALSNCFQGSSVNPAFGITFWLNKAKATGNEVDVEKELDLDWDKQNWSGACLSKKAPADMIVSLGSGAQRMYMFPSMNMVVVRQGNFSKFSDAEFLRLLLTK